MYCSISPFNWFRNKGGGDGSKNHWELMVFYFYHVLLILGYFKAMFDGKIDKQDTVGLSLHKRIWPILGV